jgi:hypothetical protein
MMNCKAGRFILEIKLYTFESDNHTLDYTVIIPLTDIKESRRAWEFYGWKFINDDYKKHVDDQFGENVILKSYEGDEMDVYPFDVPMEKYFDEDDMKRMIRTIFALNVRIPE